MTISLDIAMLLILTSTLALHVDLCASKHMPDIYMSATAGTVH